MLEEASQSFQHALKISNRYLGTHHYFSQKLLRKVQTCQTLIKKAKAVAAGGQTGPIGKAQSASSAPGSNVFGFTAQKKSIMRQHKDFLISS